MTRQALAAEAVSVRHGGRRVLSELSIEIGRGEVVGLTGPSGSGKTTLALVLSGLRRPDGGRVTCDGTPLPRRRSGRIAMLFSRTNTLLSIPMLVTMTMNQTIFG